MERSLNGHGVITEDSVRAPGSVTDDARLRTRACAGADRDQDLRTTATSTAREPASTPSHPQSEAFKEGEKQQIEALRDELHRIRAAASLDIQNLTSRLIGADREISRLKNELSGLVDEDSPEAKEVLALLKLWKREIKQDHPNVKADLRSTRAAKVRAAVKRRGVEMCRKAVIGIQFDDWAMGRVAKSGGKAFNDIAEHVLATDGDIEKWAGLYDQHYVTAPQVYRRLVEAGELPTQRHPMRIALEGLRELGCDYRESDSTPGTWVAQCPYHDPMPWSLYVRMAWGRCRLLCSHGCCELVLLMGVGFTGPSDWQESPHPLRESLRVVNGKVAA